MDNLTEWYPADVKPVRIGVYQVDQKDPAYAYWDGIQFGFRCWDMFNVESEAIRRAIYLRNYGTGCPALTTWRGLNHES